MDEKFKTSFIPKQPLVGHDVITTRRQKSSGGGGLFFYVAVTVMFLSLLSWGAMFVWANLTDASIKKKTDTLESMQEKFRPADIAKYKLLHDRIKIAVERLQSHRVVHPVFGLLNSITVPEVQYTSFTFEAEETTPEQATEMMFDPDGSSQSGGMVTPQPITSYKISMDALADSYETISSQSQKFKEKDTIIKSSVFSDFKIDDETRMISFKINATLDPKFVSYLDFINRSKQVELDTGSPGEEFNEESQGVEEAREAEGGTAETPNESVEAEVLEDEINPNE